MTNRLKSSSDQPSFLGKTFSISKQQHIIKPVEEEINFYRRLIPLPDEPFRHSMILVIFSGLQICYEGLLDSERHVKPEQ